MAASYGSRVLAGLVAVVLAGAGLGAQEPPPEVTRAQFDAWMTELSNWGRWGDDDQLGAPIYVFTLVALGVHLFDNLGLEDLARTPGELGPLGVPLHRVAPRGAERRRVGDEPDSRVLVS